MEEANLDAKTIIGKELAIQDINEARIAKMKSEFMPLVINDLEDKDQYAIIHSARMTVKDSRILIQKVAKKTRNKAITFQKDCIAEEKRLVGLIEPIEAHLQSEEDKVEAEKARVKAEADTKAAERLQSRITQLSLFGAVFNGQTYTAYGLQIPTAIMTFCTDEEFSAFIGQVQTAKDTDDARLKAEEDARKAESERLAKVAAEQEAELQRLAEISKQQAEAQALIDAEKKRIADAEREKQRLIELEQARKEAAEKAAKETEERIKREAEEKDAKAKAEAEFRVKMEEKARIAAERKAARRPDKQKLTEWLENFSLPEMELRTDDGRSVWEGMVKIMETAVTEMRQKVETL